MQRRIVEPADLSGDALAELKTWLGISRPNEDALLTDLLHTGLSMCEAFTGRMPMTQVVEERVRADQGTYILQSRPVTALLGAELVAEDETRSPLDASEIALDITPEGCATFRILSSAEGKAVAVRVAVGIGASWTDMPAPLKQGIIRLCAYYYRDRDRTGGNKANTSPPASVSALWQPFRTMRLA